MLTIRARNVNDAYARGIVLIRTHANPRASRYGATLEVPEPVATTYAKPLERVLFDAHRNINPFFHLFEALWILAGRNDVEWVAQFAAKMREFSDDGQVYHGAYGARLRHWPRYAPEDDKGHSFYQQETDQLREVINLLRRDPETRRAVVCIYDPTLDLGTTSKDIPCNDTIKFESRDGVLNMIVFCRSNDMIWGAYGTNAVQFGFLLEYVAGMVGMTVGTYTQISCNYHVYTGLWEKLEPWMWPLQADPYRSFELASYPLITNPVAFDEELQAFFEWAENEDSPSNRTWLNMFFPNVAMPLYHAWYHYHVDRDTEMALRFVMDCKAADWQQGCREWLVRKLEKEVNQDIIKGFRGENKEAEGILVGAFVRFCREAHDNFDGPPVECELDKGHAGDHKGKVGTTEYTWFNKYSRGKPE